MAHDHERTDRIQPALQSAQLDALVCALPAHVLMVSGYWPVIGASVALVAQDGRSMVLAPEDEHDLAQRGWAEVRTFKPTLLDRLQSTADAVAGPLRQAAREFGLERARIGFERGPASEPASYAAMHLYGGLMHDLLRETIPDARLHPADDELAALAAVKTPAEVDCIRLACRIAEHAFSRGADGLAAGMRETEAAALFRAPLSVLGTGEEHVSAPPAARWNLVARADGFAWCMSGPNAAAASGAYARSRARQLQNGDLALVHCNSYADGWWTDVTRTYSLGEPGDKASRMYEAVLTARDAALKTIRPGVRAADVDRSAREEIAARGFGKEFRHPTGHGIGFVAISADARPRIHPKSEEALEPGMVFNVEPAIYIDGFGGIRHCDMVAVTGSGVEVLTPFQVTLRDLIISGERARRAA